ncbi:MAG: glycosyltransferase family 39 protein [Xanthobacteraceae bacterium]
MSAAPSQRRRVSGPAIDRFDLAFVIFVLALFVLVSVTFREYAVSNDEGLQHHYGELIVAYYTSGFTDKSVFHFANLFLYGGLFDVVAVLLAHVLPFNFYDIRHVLCAFAGIGGVAATWATARMIAGPRAGLLAGLALALCGVWYGGMFNHTKDVPFAAAMMGATFYLLRAARDLPDPRPRDILWFGTLLGAALGLRVLGLLMVGYAVGLIALRSWSIGKKDWRRFASVSVHSLLLFVPAFAVGYVIMIASWPWASLDFFNPVRAVFSFANFHEPINTIIAGKVYSMSNVPRWYEPCYLAIKLPLFLLVGAGAVLISAPRSAAMRRGNWSEDTRLREIGALLFVVAFPLSCQIICGGPSYTGMRHFLFVVPPLAALAGIGMHTCLIVFKTKGRALGFVALAGVATALVWDAVTLMRLHPYEYLFYNSLVGGLEGASRRYATDYWVNIMPAAVKDLETYLDQTDTYANPSRLPHYTVAVCGERASFDNEADRRLQFTRDWSHADFFIAPTHMNCDRLLRGKIVNVIERVGVPIGVVKDLRGVSPQARWAPVEIAHDRTNNPDAVDRPHG